MYRHTNGIRILRIAAASLALIISYTGVGYAQKPAPPPKDIQSFFSEISGEWIGTVDQYTDAVKADTKYFHATIKQPSTNTYVAVFEYYRLYKNAQAPVQIGVTTMTSVVTPNGTATNTISGNGDVFIDPKTSKHEQHDLSEVMHMTGATGLIGKGSGKINVSGIAFGAGKNGKVTEYTSAWTLDKDVLSINEQFKVTFKVLFFAKHYNIIYNFKAKPGNNIAALMKSAAGSATSTMQ